MAYKPKSFDEFYYRVIDDICDIDAVIDFADSNHGKTGKYDGEMFCPECRKARLYFVHKTSKKCPHLRRCPSEKHENECSYNYDYASRKLVQEYIDSLSNNELQDKLDSIINMLCKKQSRLKGTEEALIPKNAKNKPMLISIEKDKDEVLKSLRRKRLNAWIDEADSRELFVFYGKVKLKIVEKEKIAEEQVETKNYYVLEVYNQDKEGKWKFRTSLYRGKNKDSVNEGDTYYIAIVGHVGNKAWQINLANINAVKYCKCDD